MKRRLLLFVTGVVVALFYAAIFLRSGHVSLDVGVRSDVGRVSRPPCDVVTQIEATSEESPLQRALLRLSDSIDEHGSRPYSTYREAFLEAYLEASALTPAKAAEFVGRMRTLAGDHKQDYYSRELAILTIGLLKRFPDAGRGLHSFILSIDASSPSVAQGLFRAAIFAMALNEEAEDYPFDWTSWSGYLAGPQFNGHFRHTRIRYTAMTSAFISHELADMPTAPVGDKAVRNHMAQLLHDPSWRESVIDVLPLVEIDESLRVAVRSAIEDEEMLNDYQGILVGVLGDGSNPQRVEDLRRLLAKSGDPTILHESIQHLPEDERVQAVEMLCRRAWDSSADATTRTILIGVIAKSGIPGRRGLVENFAIDPDPAIRLTAFREWSSLGGTDQLARRVHETLSSWGTSHPNTRELLHLLNYQMGGWGQSLLRTIAESASDPHLRALAQVALKQ